MSVAQREILRELGPAAGILTAGPVSAGGAGSRLATGSVSVAVTPGVAAVESASGGTKLSGAVSTTVPVRGVPGRATAFGGTRHLLFLHGRGQQGRDPDLLRRQWTAGLNQGLTLAGLAGIDPGDVYFPFYGDVLVEPTDARESVAAGSDNAAYAEIVGEAATELGMPPELAGNGLATEEGLPGFASGVLSRLHQQLSWIAARSALDNILIGQIFHDVATYLDNDAVRRRVLDTVMETVPDSGRLVLVSHSLGTVVAMDLLHRLPAALEVELLVTAGSPLGLDAVYRRLQPPGANRPNNVQRWINAWYAGDPVAIGCPLRTAWAGQLDEIAVDNPRDHAHDIAEYLAHAAVANRIGEVLI
jgi:hypothetical protein